MKISKRTLQLKPSPTLTITAKALELKAQGKDIISLSAGEPDFDTPLSIKEAAEEAIKEGFTKYTAVSGILELRKAISKKTYTEKNVSYEPSEIIVSCGAKHAIYNFFQCTLDAGDEVLIPSPYWVSYPSMVNLAEGTPIIIETYEKTDFKITPEILKKNISKKTKILVLVSPSNPTGSVYNQEELESLIPIIKENNLFVLCDDIYESLIYDNKEPAHLLKIDPTLKNQLIHVSGVSKCFAMTGWRIGWACGPQNIIQTMGHLQSQSTSNPNSIAQYAALYGITHDIPELEKMKKAFEKRRNFVCDRLSRIKNISFVKPQGAFFVFVNISSFSEDSISFSQLMLEKAGLAFVPGKEFGLDGYIRMSFANSFEELNEALNRFEKALKI